MKGIKDETDWRSKYPGDIYAIPARGASDDVVRPKRAVEMSDYAGMYTVEVTRMLTEKIIPPTPSDAWIKQQEELVMAEWRRSCEEISALFRAEAADFKEAADKADRERAAAAAREDALKAGGTGGAPPAQKPTRLIHYPVKHPDPSPAGVESSPHMWELCFQYAQLNSAQTQEIAQLSKQVAHEHRRTLKYGLAHQLLVSVFEIAKASELKRREALAARLAAGGFYGTYEHYAEGIISFLDAALVMYNKVHNPAEDNATDRATAELIADMIAQQECDEAGEKVKTLKKQLEVHRNTPHSSADSDWFEKQSSVLEAALKKATFQSRALDFLNGAQNRENDSQNLQRSEAALRQAYDDYNRMLEDRERVYNKKVEESNQEATRLLTDIERQREELKQRKETIDKEYRIHTQEINTRTNLFNAAEKATNKRADISAEGIIAAAHKQASEIIAAANEKVMASLAQSLALTQQHGGGASQKGKGGATSGQSSGKDKAVLASQSIANLDPAVDEADRVAIAEALVKEGSTLRGPSQRLKDKAERGSEK